MAASDTAPVSPPQSASTFALRDALLLVLLALMWGNSFLFIKFAVASVPPTWIVALRLAVGGMLLGSIVALRRQSLRSAVRALPTLVFVGLAGAALPWIGQAWAQQFLDSGLVAVLNSCTPVMTLFIAVLARQERLYRNRVLGLGIAITGTLIVIGGEIGAGRSATALVVGALATAGYALGSVVARARLSGKVAPLPASAVQLSCAALAIGAIAWMAEGPPPAATFTPTTGAALLALGVFGTGLGFLVYFTLIERVGATNASMVTYLAPVVGLVSGATFRGERFGANVLAGAAVLIGGVWLAQRRPPASAAAARPTLQGQQA